MEVREIKDKNIWEDFLFKCKDKSFLQSFNWGEFQIKMGNKVWRLGVFDKEELVGVALASKITARRGTFLLIQHGPTITQNSKLKTQNYNSKLKTDILKILLDELKKIGKEEGASFVRINPLFERSEENEKIFKELGFKEAPMHANAYEATWKLNIAFPEDELLMGMRKTTRYLIRQAMKNPDIMIEKSERLNDVETYEKLNKKVAERQKFVPFSFDYVKNEFDVFSGENQALLLFGKYQEKTAAAALVIFWQGIGFYHQAASDPKYAKFPIPYLILWEAIKEAKRRGCDSYDFWGYTDPQKNPKHPWAGPTLFKMGFGGKSFEYVKTQDLPLSKKYWLTHIFEKIRFFHRFGLGRTLFSRFIQK